MWSDNLSVNPEIHARMREIVRQGGSMHDLLDYLFANTHLPPEQHSKLPGLNLLKCFCEAFDLRIKEAVLIAVSDRFRDSSESREEAQQRGKISDQQLEAEVMPHILANRELWESL